MKVKICGLRETENIQAVQALGVDFVGFIFHKSSARFAPKNKALSDWLNQQADNDGHPERVGVFVNAELDYILNAVHDYRLDWVQLHGNESPGYCQELQLLWSVSTTYKAKLIKAFSITPSFDFKQTNAYVRSCPLFIFDTGGAAEAGGTGQKWDWSLLDNYQGLTPFLLSGGIGPADVEAVRQLKHPQLLGVDINSRFESAAGVKDVESLTKFIAELKHKNDDY